MKRILLLISSVCLLSGCVFTTALAKNGPKVEKTYDIPGRYEELKVSHAISVEYASDAEKMTVIADSAISEIFSYRLYDECLELKLDMKPGVNYSNASVKVILPVNDRLDDVKVSGASRVKLVTPVTVEDFELRLSGASSFCGVVNADEMDLEVSGASYADIGGKADELGLKVSGASKVSSAGNCISAREVDVDVSGASSVYLKSDGVIKGSVSGASSIVYDGDCRCDVSMSGASRLKAR